MLTHHFDKLFLFPTWNFGDRAIAHLNKVTIHTTEFFYMFQIDKMRIVGTEKILVCKKLFVFFNVFCTCVFFTVRKNVRVCSICLKSDDVFTVFLFQAARRLDKGGYVLLKAYDTRPLRSELETLYMDDSKIRDRNLSMLDRLKKQVPNFGN